MCCLEINGYKSKPAQSHLSPTHAHSLPQYRSTQCGVHCVSGILYCDISDHLPIFLSIKHKRCNQTNSRPLVRIFGDVNCRQFIAKVADVNWDDLFLDHQDWYAIFIKKISEIYTKSFPFKRIPRKRIKDKPWITKALKATIKHKNRLFRKSVLKPTSQIQNRYLAYKKRTEKCIHEVEVKIINVSLNRKRIRQRICGNTYHQS